ncbi:ATP-binding protein [Thermus oshimai]|uniref:ATP-binding protein n=1 Tax=Thermus oshimai TaxID=56957 RepID=UPI00038154C4|nr:helicase HerA-like domain-containing protein [Thermus oshimai]
MTGQVPAKEKLGVVVESRRREYWTELVLLITPKEIGAERKPLLGEFLEVVFEERGGRRRYVAMVRDAYYAPLSGRDYLREMGLGHMNDPDFLKKDVWTAKEHNFLHFVLVILGALGEEEGHLRFYPSTRTIPPITRVEVYPFTEAELARVVDLTVGVPQGGGEGNAGGRVRLGYLCYGSGYEPGAEHKDAGKTVDPALFRGRRTANFGKTGFGKSNENKVIITLVAHAFPETGFLIFDLNGEYAVQTTSTTEMGLVQAFARLGLKGRIVFYTNRHGKGLEDLAEYVEVRPLKVDFYKHPRLAVELAYHRSVFLGEKPPQYLEGVYFGWEDVEAVPNRMAYVYGALRGVGLASSPGFTVRLGKQTYRLDSREGWEELRARLDIGSQDEEEEEGDQEGERRKSKKASGGTRDLYRFKNRLSFLNRLHAPGEEQDLVARVKADLFEERGKVVILDLPSLGEMADFFTKHLMAELFQEAVELYGERQADFIVVIEEAHNLLRDEAGPFYRVAKEGRKYGMGMLYSTQSPSDIPKEILAQTENFLVKHVSSEEDAKVLHKVKVAFAPVTGFLLSEPIVGYSYVYFEPYQPFVVPLKVRLLEEVVAELSHWGKGS